MISNDKCENGEGKEKRKERKKRLLDALLSRVKEFVC